MKLLSIIKIILGTAILLLLLYKAGVKEVAATITTMNILLLPAIIILFVAGLYIGAYNLKLLTDALKIRIGMKEMWNYYLTSWAFGMVVPGKIGEFSFVYLAKKRLTTGQATAVAILDKLITVITLCALAFIGLLMFFPFGQALKLMALATIAVATGLLLLLTPAGRRIVRKLLGKYTEMFAGFSKTLTYLAFEEKKAAALNLIITFLKWGLTAIVTYLAFASFGITAISPLAIITISATTMLISLIPITMSGLGIKEGAAVYLYGLVGVPAAATISAHIVLLLLNYLGAAAVFFFVKK
ncbi:flippase-like domain-containing protein [Candidatus Woesearchaeota archaeon]|nr:flippase-like domain-containing protein [Candidatus Woesearchaeota archaeon]